jgi:hypothetical protein
MGRPREWASTRTGRPVMRSPGRPPAGRREHRVRFWQAIARGATSVDAAGEAGVSAALASGGSERVAVPLTPGDRPYYTAPAISPNDSDVYITYNAFTTDEQLLAKNTHNRDGCPPRCIRPASSPASGGSRAGVWTTERRRAEGRPGLRDQPSSGRG